MYTYMYVCVYVYIYAYAHILIHLLSEDYGSESSPESGQRLDPVPRGSPSGDRGGEKWMRFPALWQAKVAWFTDQNPPKWLEQWKPLNFQGLQRSFNREA